MKTISNNRSNAEIAAMIQAESMNDGDLLLALCLEKYLTDPSIDTEKISFEDVWKIRIFFRVRIWNPYKTLVLHHTSKPGIWKMRKYAS